MFEGNEKLCNLLVENSEITTKELNELGYYPKKINILIDFGILKREKRGHYVFASEEVLKKYKEYLLEQNGKFEETTEENQEVTENIDTLTATESVAAKEEYVHDELKYQPYDYAEKLVEQKVNELYNGKSIVLLDPMDAEERNHIHQIVSNYYDVVSFSVGKGCERRVVLRFKPKYDSKVAERISQSERLEWLGNFREMLSEARARQRMGDYEGALKYFKKMIEVGMPKDYIYVGTAFCLLRLGKNYEAIDYLKVATELSKEKKNGHFDFTNMIDQLSGNVNREERKPNFEMDLDEFFDKEDFGLDFIELDALATLTLDEGISLEEAIDRMKLDVDAADIARLIYARDCYYLERYKEGDDYLRKVANRKKKSPIVMKLMEEVRKDKRFYKNRLDTEKNCLVLKKG